MAYTDLKKRWMKENTVVISMRLSKSTDREILEHLEKQESKQGYIKELIKKDLQKTKNNA